MVDKIYTFLLFIKIRLGRAKLINAGPYQVVSNGFKRFEIDSAVFLDEVEKGCEG